MSRAAPRTLYRRACPNRPPSVERWRSDWLGVRICWKMCLGGSNRSHRWKARARLKSTAGESIISRRTRIIPVSFPKILLELTICLSIYFLKKFVNWLIDWLIDWLVVRLIDWLIDGVLLAPRVFFLEWLYFEFMFHRWDSSGPSRGQRDCRSDRLETLQSTVVGSALWANPGPGTITGLVVFLCSILPLERYLNRFFLFTVYIVSGAGNWDLLAWLSLIMWSAFPAAGGVYRQRQAWRPIGVGTTGNTLRWGKNLFRFAFGTLFNSGRWILALLWFAFDWLIDWLIDGSKCVVWVDWLIHRNVTI